MNDDTRLDVRQLLSEVDPDDLAFMVMFPEAPPTPGAFAAHEQLKNLLADRNLRRHERDQQFDAITDALPAEDFHDLFLLLQADAFASALLGDRKMIQMTADIQRYLRDIVNVAIAVTGDRHAADPRSAPSLRTVAEILDVTKPAISARRKRGNRILAHRARDQDRYDELMSKPMALLTDDELAELRDLARNPAIDRSGKSR